MLSLSSSTSLQNPPAFFNNGEGSSNGRGLLPDAILRPPPPPHNLSNSRSSSSSSTLSANKPTHPQTRSSNRASTSSRPSTAARPRSQHHLQPPPHLPSPNGPTPNGHHFASTLLLALQLNEGLKDHLKQTLGVMELDYENLRGGIGKVFDQYVDAQNSRVQVPLPAPSPLPLQRQAAGGGGGGGGQERNEDDEEEEEFDEDREEEELEVSLTRRRVRRRSFVLLTLLFILPPSFLSRIQPSSTPHPNPNLPLHPHDPLVALKPKLKPNKPTTSSLPPRRSSVQPLLLLSLRSTHNPKQKDSRSVLLWLRRRSRSSSLRRRQLQLRLREQWLRRRGC